MTLSVGDTLPDATFHCTEDGNATTTTTEAFFKGRKIVAFAVPGAFTSVCTGSHLPGFVEHAEAIKAKGVDEIVVISVNDVHVMDAWVGSAGGDGKVGYLCDWDAGFTRAAGMEVDLSARGLGIRSVRYAMVVEDGTITTLLIESRPGQAIDSSAEKILEAL